jgi:hypothetical protein
VRHVLGDLEVSESARGDQYIEDMRRREERLRGGPAWVHDALLDLGPVKGLLLLEQERVSLVRDASDVERVPRVRDGLAEVGCIDTVRVLERSDRDDTNELTASHPWRTSLGRDRQGERRSSQAHRSCQRRIPNAA